MYDTGTPACPLGGFADAACCKTGTIGKGGPRRGSRACDKRLVSEESFAWLLWGVSGGVVAS